MGRYRGVDPESIPDWKSASSSTLESASEDGLPLVIWFMGESESEADVADKEIAEVSKSDAVFIRVEYSADREESPWAEESVVPTSKLLSGNPSRDYDIRPGKSTVVIADSHGNEYFRMSSMPRANRLKTYIEKVDDAVEKQNEKLQKYLEKARDEVDGGDRRKALRYLLKNFDDGNGPVGLEAQEESIRLYHEIMDEIRTEVEALVEKGDVSALRSLEREVRNTDVEKEVEEAIDELK